MLIGRKKEIKILNEVFTSPEAEMIALIGRRRVGKTFLVNSIYGEHIIFEQTGVRNASDTNQLRTFHNNLSRLAQEEVPELKDWLDAFFQLRVVLNKTALR